MVDVHLSRDPAAALHHLLVPRWMVMLYGRASSVRPVDQPLAWIGNDRLLLNDRTTTGLRRRVIACKDEMPYQVEHLCQAYREAGKAKVDSWMFEQDGFYYLWIVWKEG
jgi:hypothetical protein